VASGEISKKEHAMDLRVYYQKIRELEGKIENEFPIVISHETGDGGKEGARSEVPRKLAAKMLVDGTARLATAEEAKQHRDSNEEARKTAEQLAAASKLQLTVITAADLERLKGKAQPSRG
jgi:hypothetical protein